MPRVKIDYVVSMSSEDPDNPASNLLAWDVSKKKWLCNVGETTCSVVLQLARAVQIESITIGTYNTALLEVLVGSSEKPNDPYEVLVPSCVVLTPRECRGAGGARVRSVPRPALAEAARRRWDRVRLVCSQPYNRHCQYGLSFVHIFEPECAASAAPSALSVSSDLPDPSVPSVPSVPRVPSLRLDALSSDDEEFRPGELFAKHSQEKRANTTTGAQIRQATSHALKNISDSSTKLVKTAISKTSSRENKQDSRPSDRDKTSLLYTDDEERPHEKIDRVVQRHNDQKQKGEDSKKSTVDDAKGSNRKPTGDTAGQRFSAKRHSRETGSSESKIRTEDQTPHKNATSSAPASSGGKKRKRSDDAAPLADVVFALSGYANPRRAAVRAAALRLGARYRPDVGPDCTHLICAFPNTPKLRAARAGVVVVTADWVERCEAARARLHWRSFATRPEDRVAGAEGADGPGRDMDNDTDDEIEKVRRDNKKKRALSPKDVTATSRPPTEAPPAGSGPAPGRSSPDRGPPPGDSDSDVTFVRDERVKGHVTLDTDDDTDTDDWRQLDERIDEDKSLPSFLDGLTFSLDEGLCGRQRSALRRHIVAYGGLVVQSADGAGSGHYHIGRTQRSSPEWLWKCHDTRRLLPLP